MMRVRYRKPPINEVIIGAYFDQPIMQLRSEHVGLFWSQLRSEFPTIQQQPEIAPPATGPNFSIQFGMTDEPYPMPRFWLSSADETILIQIQKDAFILNWRRRTDDYPHFDSVKEKFDNYIAKFLLFIQRELLIDAVNIQTVDLTYSNLVEPGDYWSGPQDTSRLFPSFRILDVGANSTQDPDFNYNTVYRLSPDLQINVSIRTARKATDASKPVLVFELRAIGVLGSTSKAQADLWYDKAHDAIGRCFTAMTAPDIQRDHWQEV